ncbi:MAG: hypothetical protein IKD08_02830 [Alphaproteobacteria bacterium]|nr:hypothetical protein [Alphaproteobacteria bacterium]
MSWLEEAEAINRKNAAEDKDLLCLSSATEQEAFKKEIKDIYEQATDREIAKALDMALEKFTPPYSRREVLYFIKQFVED